MNIANIIADLEYLNKVTAALYPVITDQVKQIEATFGVGNGANKLQLALAAIKAIYEAAAGPVPFDHIISIVTQLITATVTFYNSIAAFARTKAVAAA